MCWFLLLFVFLFLVSVIAQKCSTWKQVVLGAIWLYENTEGCQKPSRKHKPRMTIPTGDRLIGWKEILMFAFAQNKSWFEPIEKHRFIQKDKKKCWEATVVGTITEFSRFTNLRLIHTHSENGEEPIMVCGAFLGKSIEFIE